MKKYLFFFLLLAIIAMSCQKDVVPQFADAAVSPLKSAYDSQTFGKQTAESRADEERIVAFNKLLKELTNNSNNSLSGDEMPVSETVWNIEALMNASYASAGDPFAQSSLKKDSVLVRLNANGAVDQSSLPAVYQALRAKLAEQYTAVGSSNKHLVFIDINFQGIRNSTNFSNPEMMASLEVISLTGYDVPEGMPFGSSDNWRWNDRDGKCNPLTGAAIGINTTVGATQQLMNQLNLRYPKPDSRYYYVNLQSRITEFPSGLDFLNPGDIQDNKRDFKIFSVSNEFPMFDESLCISADDMNWYYQNYYDIITRHKTFVPGKDFVSIWVFPDYHTHLDPTHPQGFHSVLVHRFEMVYGNYHRVTCPLICSCTDGTCVPDPNCIISTY